MDNASIGEGLMMDTDRISKAVLASCPRASPCTMDGAVIQYLWGGIYGESRRDVEGVAAGTPPIPGGKAPDRRAVLCSCKLKRTPPYIIHLRPSTANRSITARLPLNDGHVSVTW